MRVLDQREWVNDGYYDPIAYFEMTAAEIANRCGFEAVQWDGDGVGVLTGQFLKDNRGNQYYLAQTVESPSVEWNNRTALYILSFDATKTQRSETSLTNSFVAAMQDLKIPLEKIATLHKAIDADRANWILGMGLNSKVERFSRELGLK